MNKWVASQSTGASILAINLSLDGMIDPTITGCLMKPRKNCQRGWPARPMRRIWPFSVLTLVAFKGSSGKRLAASVRKWRAAWQGVWAAIRHASTGLMRDDV